jgi:hypothetical protein
MMTKPFRSRSCRSIFWVALRTLTASVVLWSCTSEPTDEDDDDDTVGAVCGDGICNEASSGCAVDCDAEPDVDAGSSPDPDCGNGICESGETIATCGSDCSVCGDNVCHPSEVDACASDCDATLIVQNASSYNIYELYVAGCSDPYWGPDLLGSVLPPGYYVTVTDIPPGCLDFRAEGVDVYWETPIGVDLSAGETYTWTLGN